MKKFLDIEVARLTDDEFKTSNTGGFEKGDRVQITEKVDGSNASIAWADGTLKAFSRKNELEPGNTLVGFYNYVQKLPDNVKEWFRDNPKKVVFGEWNLGGNKIKDYNNEFMHNAWFVYDIYDAEIENYREQDYVKAVAENLGFNYIHVLYEGPFVDWNHVATFLHSNTYGPTQEGVVIKNQTKLVEYSKKNIEDLQNYGYASKPKFPFYLKIVNASFKEKMNKTHIKREKSADEIEEEKRVTEIAEAIVTQRRVEKGIEKLRDAGVFPKKLTPQDMGLVAKNLPKTIYDDCVKEETEMVKSAGSLFGKKCTVITMKIARQLICD